MTDLGKLVYTLYFGFIIVSMLVWMWRDAGRADK